MSFSTLTPLGIEEVEAYLHSQVPANPVLATCAHHTWSPTSEQWRGLNSMRAIRQYHMSLGWSDIGANLYAGPDGKVWTARPLDRSNWAHGLVGRPWAQVHPDAKRLCGGDRMWLNRHAIGVEIVGNFDIEDPTSSDSMMLALDLFAVMHRLYAIPLPNLLFHRMVEDKTCPGSQVSLDWFRSEVSRRISGDSTGQGQPIKIVKHPSGPVLETYVMVAGGDHIADQGKLYVE